VEGGEEDASRAHPPSVADLAVERLDQIVHGAAAGEPMGTRMAHAKEKT
jgi:hypothetical protein